MKNQLLIILSILFYLVELNAQSITIDPQRSVSKSTFSHQLFLESFGPNGIPSIIGLKRNGTLTTPLSTTKDQRLLSLVGMGQRGGGNTGDIGSRIDLNASSNWNETQVPGHISFSTTEDILLTERMRITHLGRVGIGTTNPISQLDVNGDLSLTKSGIGFSPRAIQFYAENETDRQWRPAIIRSGSSGDFIGRLDLLTNGSGSTNKLGNILGLSIRNGSVGVGGPSANDPKYPFHVTNTSATTNSSTGAMGIGELTSNHLSLDNNEINAWNNTNGSPLFLNYYAGNKVQIGGIGLLLGKNANLEVTGFTKLGTNIPSIKMIKLSGICTNTAVTWIPHGLNFEKIISVNAAILWEGRYISSSKLASYSFSISWNSTDVSLSEIGSGLQGLPYKIIIVYEE